MSAALRTFLLVSVLGASSWAQMKLNPPLARPAGGDVREFALSPGGQRAVYRADQDTDEMFELYSVRPTATGRVTTKISAPLAAGGDVRAFRIDPTGARVLYAADQDVTGRVELWSVPIDGGGVVRVSTSGLTLAGNLAQTAFAKIDPSGTRAAFLQRDNTGRHALYAGRLDGSQPPVQLTPFAATTRPIRSDFRIDPSGRGVLYRTDQDVAGVVELWAVPLEGGIEPFKLNHPLSQGGVGTELAFTANGARVIFRATDPADGQEALWTISLDGFGTAMRLDEPRGQGGLLGSFALDPATGLVVYTASTPDAPAALALYAVPCVGQLPPRALTNFPSDAVGTFRIGAGSVVFALLPGAGGDLLLYTVPLDGSTEPLPVDGAFSVGGAMRDDFVLTRDGRGIGFVATRPDSVAVFTAPADGSAFPVAVDELPSGAQVGGLQFGADGAQLLYLGTPSEPSTVELLSVPIDASRPARRLSGALVFGGDVEEFVVASSGPIVAYRADAGIDGAHALYAVPANGALPPRELNDPLPTGPVEGDVLATELLPDGERVLYTATQEEADRVELYSVATAPMARARKLNFELVQGGNVTKFRASPPAGRVVYVADGDVDDVFELYSAPLDGSAPAIRISRDLVAGGDVVDFVLSPEGTRAVYLADARTDDVFDLYVVQIDGLGSNARVSGNLPAGGAIDFFSVAFTPDGSGVVYSGDQETNDVQEIFTALLDGSAEPSLVSGVMVPGGDVLVFAPQPPFRITPDGARVVYVADALVDGVYELFSARLDGTGSPVKLSGVLVPGGNVSPYFDLTTDGQGVVYLADADENGSNELYVAPVLGGDPPRKLNPFLFSGGKVWRFQLVPEGTHVLFLADVNVRGVVELWAVPLLGGPAIRLNQPFGPRADVSTAFEPSSPLALVTPSGTHVVYRADRDIDEIDEVYAVPLDGSHAPVELNEPFGAPLFRSARPDLAVDSRSHSVFYRAAPNGPTAADLFRVPLDGARLPQRLATGVERYSVATDASRVVYLADPHGSGVVELYLAYLEKPRRTAPAPERTLVR